jgi:hypothetical protein
MAAFLPSDDARFGPQRSAPPAERITMLRQPYRILDGRPVVQNVCVLRAAWDPEVDRYVTLEVTGFGLNFETATRDEIVPKAERILDDLIAHNGWPDEGWAVMLDVLPSVEDVVGPTG